MKFRSDISNGLQGEKETAADQAIPIDKFAQTPFAGSADGRMLAHERKYTVREAAKLAGISESAMRLAIGKGMIKAIKIFTKLLVAERDLEVFLRERHGAVPQSVEPIRVSSRLPRHFAESDLINPRRKPA